MSIKRRRHSPPGGGAFSFFLAFRSDQAIVVGMRRCLSLLVPLIFTLPAYGWEAGREGTLCTLEHSEAGSAVRLTFDPAGPLYTIQWTTAGTWAQGSFSIIFEGAQPNRISTNRHRISEDGRTVTVADRGFGNVLDGLRYNNSATALIAGAGATVGLEGAGPQVDAFLACEPVPLS